MINNHQPTAKLHRVIGYWNIGIYLELACLPQAGNLLGCLNDPASGANT
jgi:hypothetical protein